MTLFSLKELWSYQPVSKNSTRFDFGWSGNVTLVNFEQDSGPQSVLVTGSFEGQLSVIMPRVPGFHEINSVLASKCMSGPILQVVTLKEEGNTALLALLLCQEFATFTVSVSPDMSFAEIELVSQLSLQEEAFNFVAWTDGTKEHGVRAVIQLLSTDLVIVEDTTAIGTVSTRCHADTASLPGPMTLSADMQSVIVGFTDYTVKSFSFELLMVEASNFSTKSTVIEPSWSICVGELPGHLSTSNVFPDCILVAVLGTESIFLLRENGELFTSIPCESKPVSCVFYSKPGAGSAKNMLVLASSGQLLVYESAKLIWALQCSASDTVLSANAGNFFGMKNMITTLSAEGRLTVGILGTDPQMSTLSTAFAEDPADVLSNLKQLNKRIAVLEQEQLKSVKQISDGKDTIGEEQMSMGPVSIRMDWQELANPFAKKLKANKGLKIAAFQFTLSKSASDPSLNSKLTVSFNLHSEAFYFENHGSSISFEYAQMNDTVSGKIYVLWNNLPCAPGSFLITASICLFEENQQPLSGSCILTIPATVCGIWQMFDPSYFEHQSVTAIQLLLSQVVSDVKDLFPECDSSLVYHDPETNERVLAFSLRCGDKCTIAFTDSMDKLLLSGSSLASLGVLLNLVQTRMVAGPKMTLGSPLPVPLYLNTLQECFKLARDYQKLCAVQFLELQKLRILEKQIVRGISSTKHDAAENGFVFQLLETQCERIEELVQRTDAVMTKVKAVNEKAIAETRLLLELVGLHPAFASSSSTKLPKILQLLILGRQLLDNLNSSTNVFFLSPTTESVLCLLQLDEIRDKASFPGKAKSSSAVVYRGQLTISDSSTADASNYFVQSGLCEHVYALFQYMTQSLSNRAQSSDYAIPMYVTEFGSIKASIALFFSKIFKSIS